MKIVEMMLKRTIILLAALVCCVVIINYYISELNAKNETTLVELEKVKRQNEKLIKEAQKYKKLIASLAKGLSANKPSNENEEVRLSSEQLSQEKMSFDTGGVESLVDEPLIQQSNEDILESPLTSFSNKMITEPDADPISLIKNKFDIQTTDDEWAHVYESNMHEMFASDESLQNMDVKDIQCKTSLCELTIYSDSPHYLSANALAKSLGQQEWRDKKALILFNDESNDGLMKFYIGKDKDSIKFY